MYCNHSSGSPCLLLIVLNADFVKGTAMMSNSFGACGAIQQELPFLYVTVS
jgi:hypothetical protein